MIRVDHQTVADLVNGHAVLTDDSSRPAFVRILCNLAALSGRGWGPQTTTANIVQWQPRRHNNVADHIANHVLESK
eukprot:7676864-Pyramimonas_sp.AAC.1